MTTVIDAEAGLVIGGRWESRPDGATLAAIDPATEERLGFVADATDEDLGRAVEAARYAQAEWSRLTWQRRSAVLRELAEHLSAHAEELAGLDVSDSGNTIAAMRNDVRLGVGDIDYYAGIAPEVKGSSLPVQGESVTFTERTPYGLVARIVPFNHPFRFAAGKVAAPLAAGNAVIIKPSEHTSLSALHLGRLASGVLPEGLLSVLTGRGDGIGTSLVSHPAVPRVAFIGSRATGRSVLRAAADGIKHVTLELGGKNPLIVFPDVDVARAADAALAGMNIARCAGQSCQSRSRIYVHASIAQPFTEALTAAVGRLRIGDPHDESTDVGPLAFEQHYRRVLDYIDRGVSDGATVACGGGRPSGLDRGFYVEPTVFTDVTDDMTIAREEIFGPVVSVLTWTDPDDAIARANATSYGLTASVWTNDVSTAMGTARSLDAGYVWVNGAGRRVPGAPFGGWKDSGLGKESGLEELLSYTREKTVTVAL